MPSGSNSGAPKYQNRMCASSGTLRIASTNVKPMPESHRDGVILSTATTSASGKASTSVPSASFSDSQKPATSCAWYGPAVSRARSKSATTLQPAAASVDLVGLVLEWSRHELHLRLGPEPLG